MKEILLKLNKFKERILSDNKLGEVYFIGLLSRVDLENKFDILISAKNITSSNSVDDLTYIINNLKIDLGDDINYISQIVSLSPGEEFINDLGISIESNLLSEGMDASDLKISDNFVLKQVSIILANFSKYNFRPKVSEDKIIAPVQNFN